jgi:hypothetical protein
MRLLEKGRAKKRGRFLKRRKMIALMAALALETSSCATVLYGPGPQQIVSISTNPPGATVEVAGQRVVSPAEVTLDRYESAAVVASKAGYETAVANIESSYSWATVADLALIVPFVFDVITNSVYTLSPERLNLELTPVSAAQAAAPIGESEAGRKSGPNS